jgi:hypothetical protein
VGIEERHEDGDLDTLLMKELLFKHLFNCYDASIGRGIDQPVELTLIAALGLFIKVECCGEKGDGETQKQYREERVGKQQKRGGIEKQ